MSLVRRLEVPNDFALLPRIAPVFLWPIKLGIATGERGSVELSFDKGREEVRLNPALQFLTSPAIYSALEELRKEILGVTDISLSNIMDCLAGLGGVGSKSLVKVPPGNVPIESGETRFECAGAIFLCDFSGQTIAQDHFENNSMEYGKGFSEPSRRDRRTFFPS